MNDSMKLINATQYKISIDKKRYWFTCPLIFNEKPCNKIVSTSKRSIFRMPALLWLGSSKQQGQP